LGHSFISGLPENRVTTGLIDDTYQPSLLAIGETARVQFLGEHLWSVRLNRWVPIEVYSLRAKVEVLRRRSRPSS
jgi:hypothetical protein